MWKFYEPGDRRCLETVHGRVRRPWLPRNDQLERQSREA